ncbi:MAG: anti-sigma factor family protein [Armatimonadota bacterium]
MNCHKIQNLLSAYVDCELSGLEMLAVRQHLSQCDECNTEFEQTLIVKRSLGAASPAMPSAELASRICRSIELEIESGQQKRVPFWKNITIIPHNKLRYAALGAGVFSILMLMNSVSIDSNKYKSNYHIDMSSLINEYPGSYFENDPIIQTSSLNTSKNRNQSFNLPWGLSREPVRSDNLAGTSHILLASY